MTRPAWSERIRALLWYVGCAPAALVWKRGKHADYAAVHRAQALALFAFLGAIIALVLALVLALSHGMVHHRDLVERWPSEAWLLSLGRKLLIVWAVFWGYAVLRAMRGVAVPVPYMSWTVRRRWPTALGAVVLAVLLLAVLVIVPLVLVAESLVTDAPDQGRVFLIYDHLDRFPRFIFSAAALPIVRTGVARYGPGSVVMLPISRSAIETALTQGDFVIIASHGVADGLILDDGYYRPEDVPALDADGPLQFVYLAGCDSGAQQRAWEAALHPATVKSYDRLTPVIEHLWWFWARGPTQVRALAVE